MGAYYKHSLLTLAAAMTGDSNGGLLGKRTPPMDPFVQLKPQSTLADGERGEVGGVKSPLFPRSTPSSVRMPISSSASGGGTKRSRS